MIREIKEINFPDYATLTEATVSLTDMGERTITTQIHIDGDIEPDFSFDWQIEFRGERYIHMARTPQASKDNTSMRSTIDMIFKHKAIVELQRYYFVEMASTESGTAIADKYEASLGLTLPNFITALNKVLNYYYDGRITAELNPAWQAAAEPTYFDINYTYIWDVLTKSYEVYACRWVLDAGSGEDTYVIKFGYDAPQATHIFEYGYNGGLLKVERQVQSTDIRNILLGRGGEKNLPYRYFKDKDTNNPNYAADPDAIPELANIYFSELRSAEFRAYVRGWKARGTASATAPTDYDAYLTWAWNKGHTDTKFDPVEYVKDDESIAKYGEQWGALDNNEDIYPSIQGSGLDDVIAVEKITSDEIEKENESEVVYVQGKSVSTNTSAGSPDFPKGAKIACWGECKNLVVPKDKIGTLLQQPEITFSGRTKDASGNRNTLRTDFAVQITDITVRILRSDVLLPDEFVNEAAIPTGNYSIMVFFNAENLSGEDIYSAYFTIGQIAFAIGSPTADENPNVFHIWIKNIWGTEKSDSETDQQYAERVWVPILGTDGTEASVSFSTGWLSVSDYNFKIVKPDAVVYDTTKRNAAGEQSHWRLTLAKSDAEFEATNKLIPNTGINAQEGDRFYFTGIDLPHQYILFAEQRLYEWKKDNLRTTADIQPAWVVSIDKVRANQLEAEETEAIINQLSVGAQIQLRDKRFMPSAIPMYIQTVTYTWKQPTNNNPYIHPDVEIVLSDKVLASTNTIQTISNELDAIRNQIGGSLSNVEQIVRNYGDRTYLRKDGIPDTEAGQVTFLRDTEHQGRTWLRGDTIFGAQGFASGITGVGGKVDRYGNAEMESLILRRFLEVPELRYNRIDVQIGNHWRAPGGGIIESVTIDTPTEGETESLSGIIYLHLEDGEIGAVAQDDLCMGIYHDEENFENNDTESSDDYRGNFHFAGFCTSYFRITEVFEEGGKASFRYALRQPTESWKQKFHPKAGMHFVCYGNPKNKERQHSRYSTLTYERYLKDVTEWEFQANNIAAQFGDLSNLNIYGLKMEGYSAYLNNIYMTGTIEQLSVAPVRMEIDTRGDYFLAYGENMVCTCYVYKGWTDVSEKVEKWTVTRESGNEKDDEAWANKDKVKNFARSITLSYSSADNDLGSNPNVISVLFHFKAEWTEDDGTAQEANYTLEI